ncbi:MAG TPA: heavy metal-binding domain-containing protein [Solirubrobacterales bacterium]
MEASTVELIYGGTERPHRVIGEVKASKGATFAWSPQPEMSEGEEALRKKAAKMGADAVINVNLDRGVSVWSWKAVKGTGTAIAWDDAAAEAPAAE